MTRFIFWFRCSLFLFVISLIGTHFLYGAGTANQPSSASRRATHDVTGTWSGTFQSRQPNFSPFTMTIVIRSEPSGRLVGTSNVSSDCLTDGTFEVTASGSKIVLAGGDPEGNHITMEGDVDGTGTVLDLKYILNSSASARCESDDGSGNLVKR
jgi:hypothetical protein